MSKDKFFVNIGATLLIVVVIGIVGLMAVPSGQYTWSDIRFIIAGCVISFWVLDILFERLRAH